METNPLVRTERHGDVAVILIDHPPVNALSFAVRRDLLAAVIALGKEAGVRAGVIACAGRTFSAGGDIREFDQPPAEILAADICAALDASTKPVVAALHGSVLGSGFEVALACHVRVLAPDGVVGFPEVRIGLIPGAGGTQRLPRLAGALVALDLVTSGRDVGADEALALDLVDEIATEPRRVAMARAHELAQSGVWSRVRDRPVSVCDRDAFSTAVASVRKRARGAIAPVRAAEAVGWALDLPFDLAVAREKALALELRGGPQSRALRALFYGERKAARLPQAAVLEARPWPLRQIGVVGGGTMGAGIAVMAANAGLAVTVVEPSEAGRRAAERRVSEHYQRLPADALRAERLSRIRVVTTPAVLADADLVVEAVAEDLAVKQAVFRRLSATVRRDCVLASNTSYLDIDQLAGVVDAPERVIGLHFFNPVAMMRLVELARTARTAPEAVATALVAVRRLGKLPVVCGLTEGCIGNRLLLRWRKQCDLMLEEGALPEDVDAALEAYGFAMGPYAAADLAGLDIGRIGRQRLGDQRARVVPIADWICDHGRFGQKSGAGWYLYQDGKRSPDPWVSGLAERASAARGITRRTVPAEEIQWRAHATIVNDGARLVALGVAQRPSDIDVVMVHGYGYPAWRGGPMREADTIGVAEMLRRVEALHAAAGAGWEPAPLLRELAQAGRSFADLNL